MNKLYSTFTFTIFMITALLFCVPAGAQTGAPVKNSLSFAVIGDTGTGDEAQLAIAKRMTEQRSQTPFDFVLMLGDNIYNSGNQKYIKPRFEAPYQELLAAGVKFYAVLGNHDVVKGLEFQTNYPNFNMGGNRYYNFTKGVDGSRELVEFFALDSNRMTEEQLGWLEGRLKESKAMWKIAFFHHPLYSAAKMHSPHLILRGQLEPLFVKYRVNAVFSGHSHCYERITPQKGVQYFTEGASGEIKQKTIDRKSPLLAAGEDMINSFLIVTVNQDQITVEAIGFDGRRIDSYTINRQD